ncbi:hypothetical protein JAAARDRAFT_202418 [Jaapia argillacea MUCL 33604]|uniref:F-box domain-containing protein n=1 Tax=Jaapia argillacea MUCL 33604 TaxID=933084 RepID=A0A067Q741_9AGAM|nr:hypothetical protein JAAARDRAFT_202418 [Jaapia argillacea MUCL 33604]
MDASVNTRSQQLRAAMRCYEASTFDALPIRDLDSTVELTQGAKPLLRACVTEVTNHIRTMEGLLRVVDEECERSRAHSLERINTFISPTHGLPPEILSRIFIRCYDKYVSLDCTLQPLLLVCKRWRDVALSTPLLWSSIGVERSHYSTTVIARRLKLVLGTFLRRSHNVPISLYLSIRPTLYCSQTLTAILPHLPRCKLLELDGVSVDCNTDFLSRIATDALSLESFSFSATYYSIFGHESIAFVAFQSPRLRHIAAYDGHTFSLPLPWAQLTHLHLGNESECRPFTARLFSCFDVLRRCVELTDFSFYSLDHRPPPGFQGSAPIVLPKLRFLQMQGSSSDYLLLDRLVAPKLTNLTYIPMSLPRRYRCYFAPACTFRRCIEQSGCNLQCLTIRPGHASWNEVIDWLHCVPSLPELRLEFKHTSVHSRKKLFQALSQPSTLKKYSGPSVVPRLRRIHVILAGLAWDSVPHFQQSLISMISSRCTNSPTQNSDSSSSTSTGPTRCLEYVRVGSSRTEDTGDEFRLQIRTHLREFVEAGITLHV